VADHRPPKGGASIPKTNPFEGYENLFSHSHVGLPNPLPNQTLTCYTLIPSKLTANQHPDSLPPIFGDAPPQDRNLTVFRFDVRNSALPEFPLNAQRDAQTHFVSYQDTSTPLPVSEDLVAPYLPISLPTPESPAETSNLNYYNLEDGGPYCLTIPMSEAAERLEGHGFEVTSVGNQSPDYPEYSEVKHQDTYEMQAAAAHLSTYIIPFHSHPSEFPPPFDRTYWHSEFADENHRHSPRFNTSSHSELIPSATSQPSTSMTTNQFYAPGRRAEERIFTSPYALTQSTAHLSVAPARTFVTPSTTEQSSTLSSLLMDRGRAIDQRRRAARNLQVLEDESHSPRNMNVEREPPRGRIDLDGRVYYFGGFEKDREGRQGGAWVEEGFAVGRGWESF
jgi:hypothetical protein